MQEKILSTLNIHKLTEEQYNKEVSNGNVDEYALYLTPDEEIDLSPYATIEELNKKANASDLSTHTKNTLNPHNVTKEQIGLNNVDNTSDVDKPISKAVQNALNNKANLEHTHEYDSAFNTSSTNPVQNKIVTAKVNSLQSAVDSKVPVERTVNGKPLSDDIVLAASDVKADATGTADSKVSAHNSSATSHADIRTLITDLTTRLNTLADSDDETLDQMSELVAYIKANRSLIEEVTTKKVDVADIIDDLTTNMTNKPLSAAQGVAIKGLIDSLQTNLNSHEGNSTVHITSSERTNWNSAKTHANSAHAPANAEKNQNAFSNVLVGDTNVSADSTTDTLTFIGNNVVITPDATNDKITFSVADGSTNGKGIVQLTNSISSTSTTTAATPNSVKSAYDLANSAKTTADGKANAEHTHKVSNITDLTATATELNYMDGVTSNVQTQLNDKASGVHSHTITASASDDDVIVLNGTSGSNKVAYSASHVTSGVSAGVYKSVTVNKYGHITSGSNPTTLSGYGITDAASKEIITVSSTEPTSSNCLLWIKI